MAYLVDGSDNILVTSDDNALVTTDSTPPTSTSSGGRRYNYVVFNMCWALLAVLPLLASNFMKWPLK